MTGKPYKSIKIVLIEPEASDVAWTRKLVESGSVSAELDDAMTADKPEFDAADVILVGLRGVGAPETELLTKLKARFPLIPLIVLAGGDAAAWSGDAVRSGPSTCSTRARLLPRSCPRRSGITRITRPGRPPRAPSPDNP